MKTGQNKLENDIRKKLGKREIQPSAEAWNRLEAMLDAAEEKKPNRTWLFIAAGVAGFLLLTTMWFKSGNSLNTDVQTAVADGEKIEKPVDSVELPVTKFETQIQEAVVKAEPEVKMVEPKRNAPILKKKIIHEAIADQYRTPGIQSINQIEVNHDVVIPAPDQEVEQLLAEAQEKPKRKIKVDAKQLLSQVDGELEYSFREKVLHSLGRNFQEVKVALANRNLE